MDARQPRQHVVRAVGTTRPSTRSTRPAARRHPGASPWPRWSSPTRSTPRLGPRPRRRAGAAGRHRDDVAGVRIAVRRSRRRLQPARTSGSSWRPAANTLARRAVTGPGVGPTRRSGDLVWVPALRPLAEVWRPARRPARRRRAAGASSCATCRRSVDGRDRRSDRPPCSAGGREVEAHEDGTVALLTYGLPGFAVDPDRRPQPVADAVLHRLAVRRLDRPAAADDAGRVGVPAAALDPRVPVRAGGRRRGLARRIPAGARGRSSPRRCWPVRRREPRATCRPPVRC